MEEYFSRRWSLFDYLKFVTPSIMAMISVSLYMVIDALFVAIYAGPLAMASLNIIMPFFSFSFGIGIMMSVGASAIIGIELGQGNKAQAHSHLSLTLAFLVVFSVLICAVSLLVGSETISTLLGASEILLPYCVDYLNIFIFSIGLVLIQVFFEDFIRLDGRPSWTLYSTLGAGITNIVADYILIVHCDMGIRGAAIGSVVGILAAIAIGSYYFVFKANVLRFVIPSMDIRFLWNAMVNGSSEMVSQLSSGVKTIVFNYVVIRYAGEYGIAAMSILMYMYFMLSSFHMGLTMGVAPVISFNFGRRDFTKIRELMRTSIMVVAIASVASFLIAMFFGDHIIEAFAKGEADVILIAEQGLAIFGVTFLMEGICIFISGYFTAVNNGKLSAMVSFLKSFIFTLGFVAILPPYLGMNGVWLSVPLSEGAALIISVVLLFRTAKRYLRPDDEPTPVAIPLKEAATYSE